jgi:hypothetical protein
VNKENFIAIIIGLVLGIIIALGVWTAKNGGFRYEIPKFTLPNLPEIKKNEPTAPVVPTPTGSLKKEEFQISLSSPEDDITVNVKEITVSGNAWPNTTIITSLENNDIITSSNPDGSFSMKATLVTGPNTITVTAFDQEGNSSQVTRTIIFQEKQ